jgi:hypothetical protein
MMLAVGVIGDLVAFTVLPPGRVVVGLAAAYGLVTLTGATVAWPLQLRRVGSLDGWRITHSLARMFLAALPGVVFAFATMAVVGSVFPAPSALYGVTSTVIGGGGALLLYAICAKLLKIDEFRVLVRSVAGRLGRLCCAPFAEDRQHVEDRPAAGHGHAQPGPALGDVAAEPGNFQAIARSRSLRVDDVTPAGYADLESTSLSDGAAGRLKFKGHHVERSRAPRPTTGRFKETG